MDKIILSRMRFFGRHGVFAAETERGQRFDVTVELELPLQAAGRTDELGATVDYCAVQEAVREVMEGAPRKLIEALAEDVAAAILEKFFPVQAVTVEVFKPEAPVEFVFDGVSVRLRRCRDSVA